MPQLFGPQNLKLWIIFACLLIPFIVVGYKATIDPALLNDDVDTKRPLKILETDSDPAKRFKDWNDAKDKIRTSLKWDFVFLFIYPTTLSLLCLIFARFLGEAHIIPFRVGIAVICLQIVAAVFDFFENVIALRIINGAANEASKQIASWCTFWKFTLIGAGSLYIVFGVGAWLYLRLTLRH